MTASIQVSRPGTRAAAEILWRALVVGRGPACLLAARRDLGRARHVRGFLQQVTTGPRIQSAAMVALFVVAALIVRARAGLSRAPVSDRIVRASMWLLTAALALAAAANFAAATNVERFLIGPFVLTLALLALVVAGSGQAWHPLHRPRRIRTSH